MVEFVLATNNAHKVLEMRAILENGRRFYVSPKEADLINERTSALVARALNRAFLGVSGV
jgi:inosine/xanthosine triphosphate pyrophosphatase family protein